MPDPEWREHFNTVYVLSNCLDFYKSNNPIFFPFEHKDVKTDIFREDGLRKVVENYSPGAQELGNQYERVEQPPEATNNETLLFEELENEVKYFNLVVPETMLEEEFQKAWLESEHSYSTEMESYPNDLNLEEFEGLFLKLNIVTLVTKIFTKILRLQVKMVALVQCTCILKTNKGMKIHKLINNLEQYITLK
eukprot:XP_766352.1 hypothetical protein [Theileria parva strain Muguga]